MTKLTTVPGYFAGPKPINVGPLATNVLDLIGKKLRTADGVFVKVTATPYRSGFDLFRDDALAYENLSNLDASYVLNTWEVHYA